MSVMGREHNVTMNLRISEGFRMEVDRIASKRNMTRAQAARTLLELGLECHKDLESVGVVRFVDMIYELKTALRKMDDRGSLSERSEARYL